MTFRYFHDKSSYLLKTLVTSLSITVSYPKCFLILFQVIDKSFGFDTAVEEAQRAINAAHVEAESSENGIGLVKLMGRHSGELCSLFRHQIHTYTALFVQ